MTVSIELLTNAALIFQKAFSYVLFHVKYAVLIRLRCLLYRPYVFQSKRFLDHVHTLQPMDKELKMKEQIF